MLFLSKLDEGQGGTENVGDESDDDEVEDDSVSTVRTNSRCLLCRILIETLLLFF